MKFSRIVVYVYGKQTILDNLFIVDTSMSNVYMNGRMEIFPQFVKQKIVFGSNYLTSSWFHQKDPAYLRFSFIVSNNLCVSMCVSK